MCSKREVYIARLSFILVVKERGWEWVRNFLLLCVHYISLLTLFNIDCQGKETFSGGRGGRRKPGVFYGGGRGGRN